MPTGAVLHPLMLDDLGNWESNLVRKRTNSDFVSTGYGDLAALMESLEHEETEMAAMAARFVNSTSRHVFLTGKAGTGKTTFLHRLAQNTHKRYVILAPTGIAALNAKGVTIHSQFLLPFGTYVPERNLPADIPAYGNFHDRDTLTRRHPLNAVRRNVLRSIDLLIIDEVSMLRADLLDAIDHRMRSVRGVYDHSFGGVQVLLIGDLHQLPPVVKDTEWSVLRKYYANAHFFESRVIKEAGYAHIELDKIFRQQDGEFIDILNNLRNNTVSAKDVETLNAHYKANIPKREQEGVITLTTHNRIADELNSKALAALPGKSHVFNADVEGKFPESMYPVLTGLELKVGAQIMFIRNDMEKAYFNGKLAKVRSITDEGVEVEMLDNGSSYTLKKEVWENKRYVVNARSKQQEEEIEGTFEQYPVKLAWAITVHKSQGLTFDKAIIDVGNAFAPGQVYVALSRLRSLKGLTLRTRIDPSVVSTDRDVMAFSERQHTQQPLPQQLKEQQRLYLQAVLTSTFDLGDIKVKVGFVQNDHTDVDEFEDASMKTALARFKLKLDTEVQNTRTFQHQLVRLLQSDDHETLLERIEKGGAYYSAMLMQSMKDLLQHLAQVEMVNRSKGYADDLREIDTLLAKKLHMIGKVGYITACILNGERIQRKPELLQKLADQRNTLVSEIVEWAELNKPKTSNRTGRRRVRESVEGVLGKKERKPKAQKGGTYKASYELFRSGKNIAEVAAERKLTESTIESHAAKGIAAGEVQIDSVLDDTTRDLIADHITSNPEQDSAGVFKHFGGKYGYGKLKMVQAWLKLQQGDE